MNKNNKKEIMSIEEIHQETFSKLHEEYFNVNLL